MSKDIDFVKEDFNGFRWNRRDNVELGDVLRDGYAFWRRDVYVFFRDVYVFWRRDVYVFWRRSSRSDFDNSRCSSFFPIEGADGPRASKLGISEEVPNPVVVATTGTAAVASEVKGGAGVPEGGLGYEIESTEEKYRRI